MKKTNNLAILILSVLIGTSCDVKEKKKENMSLKEEKNEITQSGTIHVFESDANGFNTKTIFYDDGKEVIAFDAQFTEGAAQQAIDFLRTKTSNPIAYLVVTHPNPDKFNGIPAFKKEGAKIIMSELSSKNMEGVHNYKKYYFVEMAKMFTDENYPKLPKADITFNENYEIKTANGKSIQLKELKQKGISTNQTVAYIKDVDALIVGDLVHHKAHAWLEGPIIEGNTSYNINNWVDALKTVQKTYPEDVIVYGGRGDSAKLSISIPEQINYLQKAESITKTYIETLEGTNINNKKEKVDYEVLTKKFEEIFPSYNLSYMITYGAYGLVSSL